MHFADAIGLAEVYRTVRGFEQRFGSRYWTPPDLLRELADSGGRFGDYTGRY